MWRTLLSVFLSAILGSAIATAVYTLWQGAVLHTPDELRFGFAIVLAASLFTIPGAFLLAAAEFALSGRVSSDRALDGTVTIFGAFAGAVMLGSLSLQDSPFDFALLGGFYGLTTAILFVFFQRQLGSRRMRQP
jgi:hypothetical protein